LNTRKNLEVSLLLLISGQLDENIIGVSFNQCKNHYKFEYWFQKYDEQSIERDMNIIKKYIMVPKNADSELRVTEQESN
jgi:hypothetical protein